MSAQHDSQIAPSRCGDSPASVRIRSRQWQLLVLPSRETKATGPFDRPDLLTHLRNFHNVKDRNHPSQKWLTPHKYRRAAARRWPAARLTRRRSTSAETRPAVECDRLVIGMVRFPSLWRHVRSRYTLPRHSQDACSPGSRGGRRSDPRPVGQVAGRPGSVAELINAQAMSSPASGPIRLRLAGKNIGVDALATQLGYTPASDLPVKP